MAIRLSIEGVNVECDTPQEVAALIRAAKQGEKYPQPRPFLNVRPEAKRDPALFRSTEPFPFKGSFREVLIAMKEAFPAGVSSDQIASRIGKTMRSIPIIMVALQTYAKKRNVRFEELIVRGNPPNGEKGSSYRMTDKGLKEFFG